MQIEQNITQIKQVAYVGSYSRNGEKAIFIYDFDSISGDLTPIQSSVPELTNASYLAISNDRKFLYATIETATYDNQEGGALAAFKINPKTHELTLLNIEPTKGKHPCHISMNRDNTFAFVANYSSGSLSVFPIKPDGSLSPLSEIITHKGSSITARQTSPHAHFAKLSPNEKQLYVVDLGTDQVVAYDFDSGSGKLTYNESLTITLKPGSGPRHLVFGKTGKYLYVVTELSSQIAVFEYDEAESKFKELQYISTLPENYSETSYCSAIRLSPNGKYIYASNRGHDSISAFKIDQTTGKIELVSHTPTGGNWPRDLEIDLAGKFLCVANERSNALTKFAIEKQTGKLLEPHSSTEIDTPACIVFTENKN